MLFNSYEFIFLFLPIVLAAYYVLPANGRGQLLLLTLASYRFYFWGNPRYIWVIPTISVFDYLVGVGLGRVGSPRGRKALITASIVANLSLLGFFKYAGFFAANLNAVIARVGP